MRTTNTDNKLVISGGGTGQYVAKMGEVKRETQASSYGKSIRNAVSDIVIAIIYQRLLER